MPAMTKEQYHAAGVKDATAGRRAALKPGTWQHAAYNKGWNGVPLDGSEALRGKSHLDNNAPNAPAPRAIYVSARREGKSILAAALSLGVQNWPPAAREHARRLIADVQQETNMRRQLRLITALHRMDRRHGGKPQVRAGHQIIGIDEAMNTPMTTQPCPEGPVTVGDILAGR